MNGWSLEREDTLRRLWSEGLTASQIGIRMGATRNMIIGKARRLHLTARAVARPRRSYPTNAAPKPMPRRPMNNNPTGFAGKTRPPKPLPPRPFKPVVVEDVIAPVSLNLTLMQLTDRVCKFATTPHSTPALDHRFCGQPRWNGSRYCQFHFRMAYQPPENRSGRPSKTGVQERGNLAAASFDAELAEVAST